MSDYAFYLWGSYSVTFVLLSLEIGATLLLFGAQVISEYERVIAGMQDAPPVPMRTDVVPDQRLGKDRGAS